MVEANLYVIRYYSSGGSFSLLEYRRMAKSNRIILDFDLNCIGKLLLLCCLLLLNTNGWFPSARSCVQQDSWNNNGGNCYEGGVWRHALKRFNNMSGKWRSVKADSCSVRRCLARNKQENGKSILVIDQSFPKVWALWFVVLLKKLFHFFITWIFYC